MARAAAVFDGVGLWLPCSGTGLHECAHLIRLEVRVKVRLGVRVRVRVRVRSGSGSGLGLGSVVSGKGK